MKRHVLGIVLLLVCTFSLFAQPQEQTGRDSDKVKVIHNIQYFTGPNADEKKHCLDLYLPNGLSSYPVMIFVHGGGYQKGDREEAKSYGLAFANQGIAVAAISYRLYPQVKHPEHIRDVARAFRWVKDNIKTYGGNQSQVFISGHSAGAHLASLLATDERYLRSETKSLQDIKGIIAISGGYRILPIRKDVFGDEATMKEASPFSHISKGHPPFLIIYGGSENKERHDLSKEFQNALLAAKGSAQCVEIKERDHQGLFAKIADEDPTFDAIRTFIKQQTSPVEK